MCIKWFIFTILTKVESRWYKIDNQLVHQNETKVELRWYKIDNQNVHQNETKVELRWYKIDNQNVHQNEALHFGSRDGLYI
jgi:hypothetical protein